MLIQRKHAYNNSSIKVIHKIIHQQVIHIIIINIYTYLHVIIHQQVIHIIIINVYIHISIHKSYHIHHLWPHHIAS